MPPSPATRKATPRPDAEHLEGRRVVATRSSPRGRTSLPEMTPATAEAATGASVTEVFIDAAREAGDRLFLKSRSLPNERYTYAGFLDEARAVAGHLVARGVAPSQRVAILSENRPRWCVAYLAVLLAGGVVVPIDAQLPEDGVLNILRDSGCVALFDSDRQRERLGDRLDEAPSTRVLLSLDDTPGSPDGHDALRRPTSHPLPKPLAGDDPLAIIYTSGTTGEPKGVILTHRNVRAEMVGVQRALELSGDDVLMMFLPLNHVLSQLGGFVLAAPFRVTVVHAEIKRGEELLQVVREEGVTILLAVPLLYHLIHERMWSAIDARPWVARRVAAALMALNAGLRRIGWNVGPILFKAAHAPFGESLRLLYSGGAMLDPRVQRDFHALGFTLGQAYGLTETTGCATATRPDRVPLGSVGAPLDGVSVRIVEPDNDGIGEVQLKGDIVTPGYFERPAESAALFDGEWLRTGDLGRVDARGDLTITGRIKEVIVLGSGKNIYPEELEQHYARSPIIQELCVVGQRRSGGADRTEKLHAVVVPDFDECRRQGIQSVGVALNNAVSKLSQSPPHYAPRALVRHPPRPAAAHPDPEAAAIQGDGVARVGARRRIDDDARRVRPRLRVSDRSRRGRADRRAGRRPGRGPTGVEPRARPRPRLAQPDGAPPGRGAALRRAHRRRGCGGDPDRG